MGDLPRPAAERSHALGLVEFGTTLTLRPVAALQTLEFRTTEPMQFIDITNDVGQLVRDYGARAATATGAGW